MTNVCTRCTRPCGDAYACTECAKAARNNLHHIADLAAALDDKRAKIRSNWDVSNIGASKPALKWRTNDNQTTTHAARTGFQPSTALGFDPRVSRVANRLQNGLVGIVRELPERLQYGTLAADSGPHQIARWLSYQVQHIRGIETAGEQFDLIDKMLGDLHHLFDNPPPKLFLGECKAEFEDGECTESLYLDQEKITSETVACPRCGITHDVEERRNVLMDGVNDYTGTAKEISRLLRNIGGTDVSTAAIARYVRMGKLAPIGTSMEARSDGQRVQVPVYRIGAVRELLSDLEDAKRQRRLMKRIAGPRLDKNNDRAC